MPSIKITPDAYNALRGAALYTWDDQRSKFEKTHWKIHVDREVLDELGRVRYKGETMSDTILRLVATYKGQVQ